MQRLREALGHLQANPPSKNGRIRLGHVTKRLEEIYEQSGDLDNLPSNSWLAQAFKEDNGDPELIAIMTEAGVSRTPKLNEARVIEAFMRAKQEFAGQTEAITTKAICGRACELYGQSLPPAKRPQPGTFRDLMVGPKANPKVAAIFSEN